MSIKLVKVDKTYIFSDNKTSALRGINLQIEKGEFTAFLGTAGSGKTTLLNLIGALDKPSNGKIYVDGTDLTALKKQQLAKYRCKTGFIYQSNNLIPVLSAYENIELPMLAAGVPIKKRQARTKELLERAGLTENMNRRPTELSMGDQQRVAILCALANKPSVLLADEPADTMDVETGRELVHALREFSHHEGATVIMATHDPALAALADRVFELRDGSIVKEHSNMAAASALNVEVIEKNLAQSILT